MRHVTQTPGCDARAGKRSLDESEGAAPPHVSVGLTLADHSRVCRQKWQTIKIAQRQGKFSIGLHDPSWPCRISMRTTGFCQDIPRKTKAQIRVTCWRGCLRTWFETLHQEHQHSWETEYGLMYTASGLPHVKLNVSFFPVTVEHLWKYIQPVLLDPLWVGFQPGSSAWEARTLTKGRSR